ncbi:MAG: glycosyltransferase family 2 protein [Cyanobacteria bacterium]|nr:glycosyltransferase family 2 protein [Cyanobacteriota bacterium]
MNGKPLRISVITPSFNQGGFIGRTLASVANQNYPAHEHLIFDGGSSDTTLDVLKAAGSSIRWVSRPDGGQADAVNQGLQSAEGDVIAWLNSDDIYYPGAFEQVAEAFNSDPNLDVLYGMADHIDVDDHPFEEYPTIPWNPEKLRQTCFICQPALFFRRRVIGKVGLLDASLHYCMDYNYWLRLADAGCRFEYHPAKLAGSRLYADNKTLSNRVAVHQEIGEMFKAHDGRVPLKWIYAYAHHHTHAWIDRSQHPRRFKFVLYLQTMRSLMHWNHKLDFADLQELRRPRQPATTPTADQEACS